MVQNEANMTVRIPGGRLRCGYTTGACAAAAAKAAVRVLLGGKPLQREDRLLVELTTPEGIRLSMAAEDVHFLPEGNGAACFVRKDAGDDPDVTDGCRICVLVRTLHMGAEDGREERRNRPVLPADVGERSYIRFCGQEYDSAHRQVLCAQMDACPGALFLALEGGEGVGRVTQPGLKQNIGEAAINPVPRKMIFDAAEEECTKAGFCGALMITVSVPEGKRIAEKTFNPRLGILGGISILGTTGIVKPMSEEALVESIRLEMRMRAASGAEILLLTPGSYGQTFLRDSLHLDPEKAVLFSNFVGEAVDEAVLLAEDGQRQDAAPGRHSLTGILFVAHIGKFIKVSGGIMNTHSREADCRAELCAACALQAGAGAGDVLRVLESRTTDEAVAIMKQAGVLDRAMDIACRKIRYHLQRRSGGRIRTEAVLYSQKEGLLGMTGGAGQMLEALRRKIS